MTNIEVFKFCGVSPMLTEMRARRIRVIQASVKYRADHDQWITALFGTPQFEKDIDPDAGELNEDGAPKDSANQWAWQFLTM
eukprot:7725214-Pyramimonas_sp.AAC.1